MSQGFAIYDATGKLQLSSDNIAHLLLATIFITRPSSGSRTFSIPQGMSLFANWSPSVISEFTTAAPWTPQNPRANSTLNITASGSTVSWSWVNATRSTIDSAIISVYAA